MILVERILKSVWNNGYVEWNIWDGFLCLNVDICKVFTIDLLIHLQSVINITFLSKKPYLLIYLKCLAHQEKSLGEVCQSYKSYQQMTIRSKIAFSQIKPFHYLQLNSFTFYFSKQSWDKIKQFSRPFTILFYLIRTRVKRIKDW